LCAAEGDLRQWERVGSEQLGGHLAEHAYNGGMNDRTHSLWLLGSVERRYREVQRLREIAQVLVGNGLEFLLEQLNIMRLVPRRLLLRRLRARPGIEKLSVPERVRRTLEELGPTYVKLGQMLAGRPDILPPAYVEELEKLLDDAPPEPADEIVAIIESELGKNINELFSEFDREPVAAASLAQVHRARLLDGRLVAVKVQRPGIREVIRADLDLLRDQARFLERRSAFARERRLVEVVDELSFGLLSELDFALEARNAVRLRRNLGDLPFALVPKVYQNLCTGRVLVSEYIEGIPVVDTERLVEEGYDLKAIAELGAKMYVQMIFRDGFFHADPHPGNILVVDERIALVDFGTVGYLTPELREDLGNLMVSFLAQDAARMATTLLQMGAVADYSEVPKLERALRRLLLRYYGLPLRDVKVGEVMSDVLRTAYECHVDIPSDLALLAKALIILDGVGSSLDPEFVLVDTIRPYAQDLIRQRFAPSLLVSDAVDLAEQTRRLLRRLPRRTEILLDRLEEGDITIGIEVQRLGEISRRLNEVGNRLAFALVVAALLVGSAIILGAGVEAATWRIPLLGVTLPMGAMAFIGAGSLGFWLLISIIRSRRE